ncbi:MAG: hypothetical protein K8R92_05335 [Planctomycetes bacterium]|nr:hypothetical protein [Planctomycetota bacterium]
MNTTFAAVSFAALLSTQALAGGLIMNEYNAVGSTKMLTGSDPVFGQVLNNGGNWIELVVTQDHLDIRGWKLKWAETGNSTGNGTDYWYGNGSIDQGIITFSNNAVWSDLRSGTILTVIETDASGVGRNDDFTFDPCSGDWWINVHTFNNPTYVSTVTNKIGKVAGQFSTGNANWMMEICNAANALVTPAFGEGGPIYGGSGISSTEVGKLRADPSAGVTNASFNDGDSSSFGRPNTWSDPLVPICKVRQDFAALRSSVMDGCPSCTPIALNEYNAVTSVTFLNGGTLAADSAGGAAADSYFGRVAGNGGNWIEMVVIQDRLDLRGWTLEWQENVADGNHGTVTFSQSPAISAIPSGTILTLTEKNAAGGGKDTDLVGVISGGQRWINIWSHDTALIDSTFSTKVGDNAYGAFSVTNSKWSLTFRDGSNMVVAGPFGEGAPGYSLGAVGNTSVCRLKQDLATRLTGTNDYDDTATYSTFGSPNRWIICPDESTIFTQSFAALGEGVCQAYAPWDLDMNGSIDGGDIGLCLLDFGPCPGCAADIDGSGEVDGGDIGIILLNFN